MNPVLSQIKLTPIGHILGYPASCVFIPRAVFDEYHLRAFDCTVIGEYLEICRFVVKDKDRGKGHGSRLLSDLDAWAKERGLRLCLSPVPYYTTPECTQERLISFYMKNGFIDVPDGMWCPEAMFRP